MSKHYRLHGDQQLAREGFTDLFVVDMRDAEIQAITTDDLLCNVPLCTLNLGDTVYDVTRAQIIEVLSPAPSANAAITISVGRTATAYTDCLAAFTLMTGGAATAVKTSAVAAASVGNQTIAANDTVLYAQVDITDTDGALTDLTAGIVHIAARIVRAAEMANNQA